MTYVYRLGIPIYETLLCLAYSEPAQRLEDVFPTAVLGDEWLEMEEYRKLEEFLRERNVDPERGGTMLRQLRSKQISHGPTSGFQIPASEHCPAIRGTFNRWAFTFNSSQPLPADVEAAIITFLRSFGIGEVECYTMED